MLNFSVRLGYRRRDERAGDAGASVEFSLMAAEQLRYRDNSFDLLFIRDVLHHCEVQASVAELCRVAKPT